MVTRVSDIALAVCMMLAGDDVATVFPKQEKNDSNGVTMMNIAFPSDDIEYHRLAIEKWLQKHPQYAQKSN